MRLFRLFWILVVACGIGGIGFGSYFVYDAYVNLPSGQWREWGQFYSPTEKQWIQYDRYDNGYFRDLNKTGNPFDRKQYPHYIRLSDLLKKELDEDHKGMDLPRPVSKD